MLRFACDFQCYGPLLYEAVVFSANTQCQRITAFSDLIIDFSDLYKNYRYKSAVRRDLVTINHSQS